MKKMIMVALIMAMILSGSAIGSDLITGSQIVDETIGEADLGADVTKVRTAYTTVRPSEPDYDCSGPDGEECVPIAGSGGGVKIVNVKCATGNVTGAGLRVIDPEMAYNLQDYGDYPLNDSTWTFRMWNDGGDDIKVQMRVMCI